MQDTPFTVNYVQRSGAERHGFLNQTTGHNAVGSQQFIHRIGIKLIQPSVDLIGALLFCNIPGRS